MFELNGEWLQTVLFIIEMVTELISDSRRVTPEVPFCPAWNEDGRTKHIQEALDRGAKTIVTEDSSVKVPGSVAKVCGMTSKNFSEICQKILWNPDEHLDLIGVTGTNGKQLLPH